MSGDGKGDDRGFITGLPVAEDTFGVEMLLQMDISAPLAVLILFLLMYVFFRRVILIIPPLVLAIVASIWSMGLLIGLGFKVHIMSSMIPIFVLPISVCDSVHVLSEFFDTYPRFRDKHRTILHVIGQLYMPMLYTSLTTFSGFASLVTTRIPPVKVFGLRVAFGVAAAWLLTMTLVPAFIAALVPERTLRKLCEAPVESGKAGDIRPTILDRMLGWVGEFTYRHRRLVIFLITLIVFFQSMVSICCE